MRWSVLQAYLTWDRGHLARHAGGTPAVPGGTPAVRLSTGIALCALVLSLALAACGKRSAPIPPPDEPNTYPRPYPSE
jgi:hypothetical protein